MKPTTTVHHQDICPVSGLPAARMQGGATIAETLERYSIPASCRVELQCYLGHRVRPRPFLCAILENDFQRAAMLADAENEAALRRYALLLYAELPAAAWGDRYRVDTWCNQTKRSEAE